MEFRFGRAIIEIDQSEFVVLSGGYCVFLIQSLGLPAALLGDSFLRGMKIIHDMEGKRMGLFPQTFYDNSSSSNLTWLWILLACAGVVFIAIGICCLFKNCVHKRMSPGGKPNGQANGLQGGQPSALKGGYSRVGGT
jgi:hypothetical protein